MSKKEKNLERVQKRKEHYEKWSSERIIHFLNLGVTSEAAIAYKQALNDRGVVYPVVSDESGDSDKFREEK